MIVKITTVIGWFFLIPLVCQGAYLKSAVTENHIFKEKAIVPENALRIKVPPHTLHTVTFELKHLNLEILESVLMNVSNPQHEKYGKYWNRESINRLTSNPVASRRVKEYLKEHIQGLQFIASPAFDDEYITVEGTIGSWERVLKTEFYEFSHDSWTEKKVIRALEYSLPMSIVEHVQVVTNVVQFPIVWSEEVMLGYSISPSFDTSPSDYRAPGTYIYGFVTPASLQTKYSMFTTSTTSQSSIGIFAPQGHLSSEDDLNTFLAGMDIPTPYSISYMNTMTNNPTACSATGFGVAACAQLNAELQYATSLAPGVPITVYGWDSGDIVAFLQYLYNAPSVPQVLTIGYTIDEALLSPSYVTAFNQIVMKLTMLGVSIVVSSGNDGASGYKARNNYAACMYNPQFPATSPWVTAVGSTQGLEYLDTDYVSQGNTNSFHITSGGGFSNVASMPSWQSDAVNSYLARMQNDDVSPATLGYNSQGRGYPDIAAAANNFIVVLNGTYYFLSGAAMSVMVVASMIANMNTIRMANIGGSGVGFLNPTLYTNTGSFVNDLYYYGYNRCGAGGNVWCAEGFYSATGWDAVSGMGVINFGAWYYSIYGSPFVIPDSSRNMWVTAPVYSTSGTIFATQQFNTITFNACPGNNVMINSCDVNGIVPEPYPSAYFRVYDNLHMQIGSAGYNGGCDSMSFSAVSNVQNNSICQAYTINAGCYGNVACSGQISVMVQTTTFYPTLSPTTSFPTFTAVPSTAPSYPPLPAPFTQKNVWNYCSYYSGSSTNYAAQYVGYCTFYACSGTNVRFSTCVTEVSPDGLYTNSGTSCVGDTYLRYYNANTMQVGYNDDSGTCGVCSASTLVITDPVCQQYVIWLGCFSMNSCSYTLGVYMY